jgi:hypothetical protein
MQSDDPITARLRRLCLALPEAAEKETWGDPTFRVRDRIFAMANRGDGRVSGEEAFRSGADQHRLGAGRRLASGRTGRRWRCWSGAATG